MRQVINLDPDSKFSEWYVRVDSLHTHSVELSVFKVMSYGEDNVPMFNIGDADNVDNLTEKMEDAPRYAHCYLKWDACNHWYFDAQEDCMLHLCGLKNLDKFLKRIKDVTMLGKQLIEEYDPSEWDLE